MSRFCFKNCAIFSSDAFLAGIRFIFLTPILNLIDVTLSLPTYAHPSHSISNETLHKLKTSIKQVVPPLPRLNVLFHMMLPKQMQHQQSLQSITEEIRHTTNLILFLHQL